MSQETNNEDDDFSSNESDNELDAELQLSLNTLPVEVFLHICSFLDSSTLVHRLGLVCRQFYNILRDDSLWKGRINKLWPNRRYPILPYAEDNEFFWKSSCFAAERHMSLWNDFHTIENLYLKDAHEACVDALLLMDNGRICVSGGRDRVLVCWRLLETVGENMVEGCRGYGHDGWIWDIISMHNKIYSCSWDKRIHIWDLDNVGIRLFRKLPLQISGAFLCITSNPERNLLAAGSSCKTIYIFDPRDRSTAIERFQPHRGVVLNITMDAQYIISTSEDKTVSVWDQRLRRTIKTFPLSKDSYAKSLFLHRNAVYVGDSEGYIHVLDINENFKRMKSFKTEHTQGITGIHMSAGCLITSSLDSSVKISTPTDPPHTIATLTCEYGKIVRMSYLNEVLAVCGGNSVQIWRPRTGVVG